MLFAGCFLEDVSPAFLLGAPFIVIVFHVYYTHLCFATCRNFFLILEAVISFLQSYVKDMAWVWPPHSNSDHQEYYIFNRESL